LTVINTETQKHRNSRGVDYQKALAVLHRMNINVFSLFGTEDSLLDTLATMEVFLKE
jgi:hypothetical protein